MASIVEVEGILAGLGLVVVAFLPPSLFPSVASPVSKNKLSMFFGVTVPCILSIFSVILFLRMGYILGQVRGGEEVSVGSAVLCIWVWVSEVRHCREGVQIGVVHRYNVILVKKNCCKMYSPFSHLMWKYYNPF